MQTCMAPMVNYILYIVRHDDTSYIKIPNRRVLEKSRYEN